MDAIATWGGTRNMKWEGGALSADIEESLLLGK